MPAAASNAPGGAGAGGRPVSVLCLGNELVRDDGVGVRIGRVLRQLALPSNVTVELRRALGFELLEELDPGVELVLVDAARPEGSPGRLRVLELDATAELAMSPSNAHSVGVAEVLLIARALGPGRLPPRVAVVTVEAGDIEHFGLELTAPVSAALPAAVETVLDLIAAPPGCRDEGRRLAELERARTPTMADVLDLGATGDATR